MAVSSISGSSSIYGTRNVLSGLASGMDTESMIENAISAYKTKISSLNQKRMKTVWQQEAYRSMITKMSSFLNKYMSYQSSNNLMSVSFWNQSVKTVAKGANADKVSAVGKASSNVQIDRVLQLATAATYKYSGASLDKTTSAFGSDTVSSTASGTLDLDGEMELSGLSGSLTLAYGGSNAQTKLRISFDDTTLYENQVDEKGNPISKEQALVNEINRQLESQSVTIGSTTYTGKDLTKNVVRAELKDGKITFADPKGNNVYVSSASGDAEALLGGKKISDKYGEQVKELSLSSSKVQEMLDTQTVSTTEYLKDKSATLNITVDGVSKAIRMPDASKLEDADGNLLTGEARDKAYLEALQKSIDSAFGKGKLTVSDANGKDAGIQFKFEAAKGSTFSVSSDHGKALGFGESGKVTSYLNTGKTLGELVGEDKLSTFAKAGTDANGNELYSFKVNGVEIGKFSKDSTLDEIMSAMNSSDTGVNVSYSRLTNELTFTAKETGAAGEIKFEGLSAALFGEPGKSEGTYTKGQNAIFEASINGTSLGQMERSSNSVSLDGMTINLKGTFGYETNEDGSSKIITKYAMDGNRILFTASNGQALYGDPVDKQADGSVKTVKMQNEAGEELRYKGRQIYGSLDDSGNLSFYVEDENGDKTTLYLTNDGFSDKNYSESQKMVGGQYVYTYGSGKTLYAADQGDNTFKVTGENGKSFTYWPSSKDSPYYGAKVYGKLNEETGNLDFYVKGTDGSEMQVYLRADGSVTRNQDQGSSATAVMTRTAGYTADTTVTKTGNATTTEAVTFESSSDSDKIVDLIKQMVNDYNEMVTEIKNAYSTLPAQRSNGMYYEPLTDEDEADMSESAIKSWNEKAQQGILFGDSDLRNLYSQMTNAISMTGEFGAVLRNAGITVNYADGLSTLSFDEDKFRTALENDPDKVRDAFTATTGAGASQKGLMQALKMPLEMYGKTSGGKGILVEKAGSPLAASTLYSNNIQTQLNNIDAQIEKWQTLMSNKIDFYTKQFSKLEQLVMQMNSQSSYFSQLTGY